MTALNQTYAKDNAGASEDRAGWERPPLLTAERVAERCDLPVATVYQMARENRIGGLIRLGRLIRFDPDRFEAWLDAGGEPLPGGWRHEADR